MAVVPRYDTGVHRKPFRPLLIPDVLRQSAPSRAAVPARLGAGYLRQSPGASPGADGLILVTASARGEGEPGAQRSGQVGRQQASGDKPLGYLLHRAAGALRTEMITTVLEPLELTVPGYLCMRALSMAPGRSNAQLARDANVSPQAMNKVIRELQRRVWSPAPRPCHREDHYPPP